MSTGGLTHVPSDQHGPESRPTRPLKRAVVTGGAGFIGSHLCQTLLDGGSDVVCIDNFATGSPRNIEQLLGHPSFRLIEADVADGIRVDGPIDVVFHLALVAGSDPLADPAGASGGAAIGTLRTLAFAAERHARFVLVSSPDVYGDSRMDPQPENGYGPLDPCDPRELTPVLRSFGEAATTAHRAWLGADTAVVRLFNTYGPRMPSDDGRPVPTFIRQAADGSPLIIRGAGNDAYSMCYVADAVRGLVDVAASGLPGPVNIGDPAGVPLAVVAQRILTLTGSSSVLDFAPGSTPVVRRPDITVARELLGWSTRTRLDDGLAATIHSMRVRAAIA